MVKELCYDINILSKKSIEATKEDIPHIKNLLDTIEFHKKGCVGMALNMIGITKRVIVCEINNKFEVMINPECIKKSIEYITNERCLCHKGETETKRYKKIKIKYFDINFKIKIKTYEGFEAQIIQHELDHLEGVLI